MQKQTFLHLKNKLIVMLKLFYLFLFCHLVQHCYSQTDSLSKISKNDKIGYINQQGKIIIPPRFLNGQDFFEGLAAVRENGLYGFINTKGEWVIRPEYDFADRFVSGMTLVYKSGTPILINKKGKQLLSASYKSLFLLNTEVAIVTTLTNKQGVIDIEKEELIIDTIYKEIQGFENGVSIATKLLKKKRGYNALQYGVIDSIGNIIVPFGKFKKINSFVNGVAVVEVQNDDNDEFIAAINTKGKVVLKKKLENKNFLGSNFKEEKAVINLYKNGVKEEKGISYSSANSYKGIINLKGEIMFKDSIYEDIKEFSNGRSFVSKKNENYILIDGNYKRVGNKNFIEIVNNGFYNNYAIVETKEGFGIIDANGLFIIDPVYEEISDIGIINNYFFYKDKTNDELYGISNLNGKIITKPIMQKFSKQGFINGLIEAMVDDTLVYINKEGEIVWKKNDDSLSRRKNLNIDYMNRGYFYAYSSLTKDNENGSGGWASSNNYPKKINSLKFTPNNFSVTIDANEIETFANEYVGYKLFVTNSTNDTVNFDAQDSRIYMKLQAQNSDGEWKDIEYLPSSWCGNSYHKISLEPNTYWSFTIPKYTGEFKTEVRAVLYNIYFDNKKKAKLIYSNSVPMGINPAQFWNKRRYYPDGIMDPYND